jgi:hypothetical protein
MARRRSARRSGKSKRDILADGLEQAPEAAGEPGV